MKNNKAIYAGSFDPFTNGHLDIVRQASKVFDEIIIVIAENSSKTKTFDSIDMLFAIKDTLKDNGITNCHVVVREGLISEFAKREGINYLIRGLRNPSDYVYEESVAKINKELNPDLNTIYFRTSNDVISSTLVRELLKYEKDVSKYVSSHVMEKIFHKSIDKL